jgi:hypothetical protein
MPPPEADGWGDANLDDPAARKSIGLLPGEQKTAVSGRWSNV